MKNPFSLKGRASRKEYLIINIIYFSFVTYYFSKYSPFDNTGIIYSSGTFLWSTILLILALIILTTAYVRRLHDIGFSGWWQILVCLLPVLILGLIIIPSDTKPTESKIKNTERIYNILKMCQLLGIIITIIVLVLVLMGKRDWSSFFNIFLITLAIFTVSYILGRKVMTDGIREIGGMEKKYSVLTKNLHSAFENTKIYKTTNDSVTYIWQNDFSIIYLGIVETSSGPTVYFQKNTNAGMIKDHYDYLEDFDQVSESKRIIDKIQFLLIS